ncbi:hypothetical protein NDU88_002685 [Pleurodeles waltl]|uniref:Uncharacterized protein n=1 Tax=Pleurodeles waltl TaxID=8319 RepID=A0AAV7RAP8_PLEWA|nr:hypothetical protein NDU88_002685 [Pleurodeles waltl]
MNSGSGEQLTEFLRYSLSVICERPARSGKKFPFQILGKQLNIIARDLFVYLASGRLAVRADGSRCERTARSGEEFPFDTFALCELSVYSLFKNETLPEYSLITVCPLNIDFSVNSKTTNTLWGHFFEKKVKRY